jgi:hypothetical protein
MIVSSFGHPKWGKLNTVRLSISRPALASGSRGNFAAATASGSRDAAGFSLK